MTALRSACAQLLLVCAALRAVGAQKFDRSILKAKGPCTSYFGNGTDSNTTFGPWSRDLLSFSARALGHVAAGETNAPSRCHPLAETAPACP